MEQQFKPAWQMKAFPVFLAAGWILIIVSLIVGAAQLAPAANSYFGGNDKATRDSAETGSSALAQLETLSSTPRWLEPLTFVGVASFMVGIALAFSSIPALLENRGSLMSLCVPLIARSKSA